MALAVLLDFLLEVEEALRVIQETFLINYEGALVQSQLLLRDVVYVEELMPGNDGEELVDKVLQVVLILQSLIDRFNFLNVRGRPRISISEEQLRGLLDLHFTNRQIAKLYNISSRTVRRRIIEYGLDITSGYSDIDDASLDTLLKQYLDHHRLSGEKSVTGYLRSIGMKVQRYRVRESITIIDPRGVEARFRNILRRREYNVRMPNSLWHIDGYHKLVRWRIIIHGGIDGYSRLSVYLSASNNNCADTVLGCFVESVSSYGLPSRVCCDKGGENVLVSEFMLNHPNRGPGRGSCITGRSVHNQRIERLWRDVFTGCVLFFYHLFYELEDLGLVSPCNEYDLFFLHYVYLAGINMVLNEFKNSYSHHPLRTVRNRSPLQLWTQGLIESTEDSTALDGVIQDQLEDFGIDWSGPLPVAEDSE